jgi:methyl-accepting chemotaxis protein
VKPRDVISKIYLRNFLFMLLVILLSSTAISALVLYFNIHKPLNTHYSAIVMIISELNDIILVKTLTISAVFSVLAAIALFLLGIFYTHKIAGPLYRIKMAAKSISMGDLGTKIILRRKDVIQPFAESLNSMTENYSNKIRILDVEADKLHSTITELKSLTKDGKESDTAIRRVSDMENQINSLINDIKL